MLTAMVRILRRKRGKSLIVERLPRKGWRYHRLDISLLWLPSWLRAVAQHFRKLGVLLLLLPLFGCKPTNNMEKAYRSCGGLEGVQTWTMEVDHLRVVCKNGTIVCWWYLPKGGECK